MGKSGSDPEWCSALSMAGPRSRAQWEEMIASSTLAIGHVRSDKWCC